MLHRVWACFWCFQWQSFIRDYVFHVYKKGNKQKKTMWMAQDSWPKIFNQLWFIALKDPELLESQIKKMHMVSYTISAQTTQHGNETWTSLTIVVTRCIYSIEIGGKLVISSHVCAIINGVVFTPVKIEIALISYSQWCNDPYHVVRLTCYYHVVRFAQKPKGVAEVSWWPFSSPTFQKLLVDPAYW